MKKKLIMLMGIGLLMMSLTACSEAGDTAVEEETTPAASSEEQKETGSEEKSVDSEAEVIEETTDEQTSETSDEALEEEEESGGFLDKALSGFDLIQSITVGKSTGLKVVSTTVSYGATTQSTTYYNDSLIRTEVEMADYGKTVTIINNEDETVSFFTEGEADATKLIGADAMIAEEMGLSMDLSYVFEELKAATDEGIEARVDTLDGREVVYIESNENDEEVGDILVKMWYSVDYAIPLKYEVYLNEADLFTMNVTSIEEDFPMDESLFMIPEEYNVNEVDASVMLSNW